MSKEFGDVIREATKAASNRCDLFLTSAAQTRGGPIEGQCVVAWIWTCVCLDTFWAQVEVATRSCDEQIKRITSDIGLLVIARQDRTCDAPTTDQQSGRDANSNDWEVDFQTRAQEVNKATDQALRNLGHSVRDTVTTLGRLALGAEELRLVSLGVTAGTLSTFYNSGSMASAESTKADLLQAATAWVPGSALGQLWILLSEYRMRESKALAGAAETFDRLNRYCVDACRWAFVTEAATSLHIAPRQDLADFPNGRDIYAAAPAIESRYRSRMEQIGAILYPRTRQE